LSLLLFFARRLVRGKRGNALPKSHDDVARPHSSPTSPPRACPRTPDANPRSRR
jgi:hypothetical protein